MKKSLLSLEDLPLKRKIFIAFSLISLIPLLVIGVYVVYKYLPYYTYFILGVNILLGWWIITHIFTSIASILKKTKKNADVIGKVSTEKDEVKILDEIFDKMSSKIKRNFEELREISKSTERLNQEVVKKVSLLSSIMQINDLVSQEIDISEVFKFIAKRIKDVLNLHMCFILLDDGKDNFRLEAVGTTRAVSLEAISKNESFLVPLLQNGQTLVLDQNHPQAEDLKEFAANILKLQSAALIPMFLKENVVGILGIARREVDYIFSEDDLESLNIFSRHISLLMEHKDMSIKIRDLEIKDALTGLYNSRYMEERLDEEIQRAIAYQRPCGFILFKIKDFKKYMDELGVISLEKALRNIAHTIKDNLDISEKAGRTAEDELSIIAPEKSKNQLEKEAADILSKIKYNLSQRGIELDLGCSIAENPIDGVTSSELINKAKESVS